MQPIWGNGEFAGSNPALTTKQFKTKDMKLNLKSIALRLLYGTIEPKGEDVSKPMKCRVTMPESRLKLNKGSLYENLPQL